MLHKGKEGERDGGRERDLRISQISPVGGGGGFGVESFIYVQLDVNRCAQFDPLNG